MAEKNTSSNIQFTEKLFKEMGGQTEFDMLIFEYCERIEKDKKLKRFFGTFSFENLCELEKELVMLAFSDRDEDTEYAQNKMVLHHFRLFEQGLNGDHFDRLKTHLTNALRESWIADDVVEVVIKRFSELRFLFVNGLEESRSEEETPEVHHHRRSAPRQTNNVHQASHIRSQKASSGTNFFARIWPEKHAKEGAQAA